MCYIEFYLSTPSSTQVSNTSKVWMKFSLSSTIATLNMTNTDKMKSSKMNLSTNQSSPENTMSQIYFSVFQTSWLNWEMGSYENSTKRRMEFREESSNTQRSWKLLSHMLTIQSISIKLTISSIVWDGSCFFSVKSSTWKIPSDFGTLCYQTHKDLTSPISYASRWCLSCEMKLLMGTLRAAWRTCKSPLKE